MHETYLDAKSTGKLKFAVSCSSNMNRSMEAHFFLKQRGFNVQSFGSGTCVKLPGPSIDRPNIYEFDSTTYEEIYQDLRKKDAKLYTQNGLLNMLDRNRRIKKCPQKFQNTDEKFAVIICLEERVYDQIVEFLQTRDEANSTGECVHVINFDIQEGSGKKFFQIRTPHDERSRMVYHTCSKAWDHILNRPQKTIMRRRPLAHWWWSNCANCSKIARIWTTRLMKCSAILSWKTHNGIHFTQFASIEEGIKKQDINVSRLFDIFPPS